MKRLALMFAAASLAVPASAQSLPDESHSVTISVAGIRFGNPGSVADLRARIARALRWVCATDGTTLLDHRGSRTCRVHATEQSERQLAVLLDRTRLAALRLDELASRISAGARH